MSKLVKDEEDFLEEIETLSVGPNHCKEISTLSPGDQLEKLDKLCEKWCQYDKSKTRNQKKKEQTNRGDNFNNECEILVGYLCLFDTTTLNNYEFRRQRVMESYKLFHLDIGKFYEGFSGLLTRGKIKDFQGCVRQAIDRKSDKAN